MVNKLIMKEDYYDILGISKTASDAEIKKAYRKKAIQYHPDKNPGDSEAELNFKKAAEAYEVLGNPDKKARYDQFGHQAFESGQGFSSSGMSMDDIFSQFGDIFGSAFGGGFEGFGGSGRGVSKGANLRIRVKLSLQEIFNGVDKKVKVKRKVKAEGVNFTSCSDCGGSGQSVRIANTILGRMQTTTTCSGCSGTGQVIMERPKGSDSNGMIFQEETVSIKIPAGVEEGMQLKVSGKGNEAFGNGIAGDLIVLIEELEHDKFTRDGGHLHFDLYISLSEAALGCSKEVQLVEGKVRIKLESGIQSGKTLRLRGKGLPDLNSYSKGDLLVHINVWTPQVLNREQKQFFQRMKGDENFEPRPEKSDKSFFEKVKDMFS